MEPVTAAAAAAPVLAECADLIKAAVDAVPPGGRRRQWDKARRVEAYDQFQEAAHRAAMWPGWLTIVEQAVLDKRLTMAQAISEMAACRSDTALLLGALSKIRLAGNPDPRRVAEEIVTLLAELMEARIPGRALNLRVKAAERLYAKADMRSSIELAAQRFPRLAGRAEEVMSLLDQGVHEAQEQRFSDCQRALGTWHKKFSLAARKDLGYGPRPWQVGKRPREHWWQVWRPHEEWPGGWPPPEASELVSQARAEREARLPAQREP